MPIKDLRRPQSSFPGRPKKKIRKDYQHKKLDNPFFNRKENQKKRISKNLKFTSLLLIAIIIGLFWFIFYANFFQIKNIEIIGLNRINNDEIRSLVYSQQQEKKVLILKQSNIFIFSEEELKKNLTSKYNFSKIEISKQIPATIKIIIEERPCALIWEGNSACYYLDPNGYLIKEIGVKDEDKNKLPIITDTTNQPLDGSKVELDSDSLKFMVELYQKMNDSDLKVERFILDKEFHTVKAKIANGPTIFFNVKDDQDKQLKKLIIVKREKLGDDFQRTNYIDLRYGDKVFFQKN